VNGAAKASIMNTSVKADQAAQLNFDLKPAVAAQASAAGKSGKHKVWVPSNTGSHIGGSWVEVDESGNAGAGALNVKRGNAESVRQQQLQNNQGPQSLPGYNGNGSGPYPNSLTKCVRKFSQRGHRQRDAVRRGTNPTAFTSGWQRTALFQIPAKAERS